MSNSGMAADEGGRMQDLMLQLRGRLHGSLPRLLKITGAVILIAGLQIAGFYSHFVPAADTANLNLDRLIDEVATNTLVDKMLSELQDFHRLAEDEAVKKEVVLTYERFVKEFVEDPRMAIGNFENMIAGLPELTSALGNEALLTVKRDLARLKQVYTDHYQVILDDINSPPLYLQPVAALIKGRNDFQQKMEFNHGLYLSVVGDLSSANTIFNELKQEGGDADFMSVVHYTQALMLYSAFKSESKIEYFQQALQSLKQSLQSDADFGMPKLFLEYLLSMESGRSAENYQVEGEGTGEAQGEQGVISKQTPTF